jgi:hypothetical protein
MSVSGSGPVQEVYDAMDGGDCFWTYGKQSRRSAWVEKHYCEHCYAATLRSAPEAVKDNVLSKLPRCNLISVA